MKLQRPALALGLYGSILALVLAFSGQPPNHLRHTRLGETLQPILASVAKCTTSRSDARLPPKLSPSASTQLQRHFFFERNDGQADRQVLYLSHGPGYSLFLTRTGATIVVTGTQKKERSRKPDQYVTSG